MLKLRTDLYEKYFGEPWVDSVSKYGHLLNDPNLYKRVAYDAVIGTGEVTPDKVTQLYYHPAMQFRNANVLSDVFINSVQEQAADPELRNKSWMYRFATDQGLDKDAAILDFGCGAGDLSLHLFFNGYKNVTLVNLGTPAFRMLKEFLATEYGVRCVVLDDLAPITFENYDYVICSEVMEHCFDPVNDLRSIVSSLKIGGIMYLSVFFNCLEGADPTHLHKNCIYQDTALWFEEVKKAGLELIWKCPRGTEKGYRRVR